MFDTQYNALGMFTAVDQLALSRRAANTAALRQAAREQKQERKRQRDLRRQEAYTTAV